MDQRYEPKHVEPKWQERWERDRLSATTGSKPKHYVLEMFPYPSGAMHMGHVRNYLIGDVIARYARTRGFDVLHPMGWDALGLPAENAAIKDKRHPAERTAENIVSFRAEMKRLGFSYDWSRELSTSDPEYYRWNQWFFLEMHARGLVYRRRSQVNFCPSCNTVIANEQVKDGACERCSTEIELRRIPEWAFRITKYSERLLANLDALPDWDRAVIAKQREWIGKSEGVELEFRAGETVLTVFTTRADTVFGCTCLVIAPDHPAMDAIATDRDAVRAFAQEQARKAKRERAPAPEGMPTGGFAIHPFTNERIPIWAANYVLADYGTGAVMCVPAHDTRDHAFATKYGLPVKPVIRSTHGEAPLPFVDDGILFDSGPFTDMTSAAARAAIPGRKIVTYRQRDWGFSRQRYWGTPIPIVYCDACDPAGDGIPVPKEQLPVRLPPIEVEKVLTGRGEPPLAKVPEFVATTCPRCGGAARREVETMDTFVDSAWYFARYFDPHDATQPFSRAAADHWLPIDVYIGGPEHSTMHLLYFRFWTMVMHELGLVAIDEPVRRMITQGIVKAQDGRKMGKRYGNSVEPATIVEKHGADAARLFVMFAGPIDEDVLWSDTGVEGCSRFLQRAWRVAYDRKTGSNRDTLRAAHKTLKRVTEDLERRSFNTAIARIMELVNTLTAAKDVDQDAIRILAWCLSPFAPHVADEIAEHYGATTSLQAQSWPAWDPALAADDVITYAVKVNGKVRAELHVAATDDDATIRAAAEANVKSWLAGKQVTDFRLIRGKLVIFTTA